MYLHHYHEIEPERRVASLPVGGAQPITARDEFYGLFAEGAGGVPDRAQSETSAQVTTRRAAQVSADRDRWTAMS